MDDERTEKIDFQFPQGIRDEPDDILKFKKVVGFLILHEDSSTSTFFPLYDGVNRIGRAKDNQVFIDNKALSRHHAIIEMEGNTSSVIFDLESANETMRGQVILKPGVKYNLENNDVLWFGNVKTTFEFSNTNDEDDATSEDSESLIATSPKRVPLNKKNTEKTPEKRPPLKDLSNLKEATDCEKTASFIEKSNIFDDTEDSVRINEEQLAIPGTSKSSVVHEVFKKLHNLHDTMDSVSKVPPGEQVLKKNKKIMISSDSDEDELPVIWTSSNSASKALQENRAKEKDFAATETVSQTMATRRNRRARKAPNRLDTFGFNIMFNDLTCPISEKIIKSLGGNITEDINLFSILIADKFRRTIELVCAFAMGVPVINGEWIKNAKKEKTLKNYEKFMLKDRDAESKYSFKIEETLKRASETPLFTGWSIHVTKNVVPAPRQMKDIIKCAGGNFLAKMPKKSAEKTIIVSCEEDLNLCNDAKKNGIPIVDYEFILTGILAYQIDIEKHKL